MNEERSNGFLDFAILFFTLLLCIGSQTLFPACAPKPDGSWMMCHASNLVVTGTGAICSLLAFARLFLSRRLKTILSAAIFAVSFFTMPVPGYVLPLCRMAAMQCQAIFRPAVLFVGILLCIVTGIDIWFRLRKG